MLFFENHVSLGILGRKWKKKYKEVWNDRNWKDFPPNLVTNSGHVSTYPHHVSVIVDSWKYTVLWIIVVNRVRKYIYPNTVYNITYNKHA